MVRDRSRSVRIAATRSQLQLPGGRRCAGTGWQLREADNAATPQMRLLRRATRRTAPSLRRAKTHATRPEPLFVERWVIETTTAVA